MASPLLALDHLQIASTDLETDARYYETLLGCAPVWRGSRDGRETLRFAAGNVDVLLAADDSTSGLVGAAFRVDALTRLQRRARNVGLALEGGSPHPDGSPSLRLCDDSAGRGLTLSFLEREAAPQSRPTGVTGLDHIVIASADATATAYLLGSRLGLDLRMDISRADWNARLLFFRCDDLIVEVFQTLDGDVSTNRDQFYGLSWRVANAEATRERLSAAGFDVSDVRKGRRPGTRVLTVRDHTAGVATLLLQPPDA